MKNSLLSAESLIYYLYFIILFMSIGVNTTYNSTLFYIISATVSFLLFLVSIYHKKRVEVSKWFLILFSVYYVWLIGNSLFISDGQSIQYAIITPLIMFSVVLFAPKSISSKKMKFASSISLIGVIFVLLGILFLVLQNNGVIYYSAHTGRDTILFENMRISSIFANSNTFGQFMCIATLSSFYLALQKRDYSNYMLFINLFGLLLSNGQSAYFGFITGVLFLLFYQYSTELIYVVTFSIVVYIGTVLSGLLDGTLFEQYLSHRNYLWRASLNRAMESPWFGIDYTYVSEEIGPYAPKDTIQNTSYGTHSTYIGIILRYGFIGGISYILSLYYVAVTGSKFTDSLWDGFTLGCLVALLVIMIHASLTLGGLSMDSIMLATFLGLVLSNLQVE